MHRLPDRVIFIKVESRMNPTLPQDNAESPESRHSKEPWVAAFVTFAWVGAGQIYAGRKVLGFVLALLYPILGIIALYTLYSPHTPVLPGLVLIPVMIVLPFAVALHAFFSTRAKNSTEFEQERRSRKDPWLAVFLSAIFPPLGYLYLKRWVASALVLAAYVGVVVADYVCYTWVPDFHSPLYYVLHFFVARATYRSAKQFRATPVRNPVQLILVCFLMLYGLRLGADLLDLQVKRVHMAFPAMSPALQLGDRMLITRRFDPNIARGTIVNFRGDDQRNYLRRVAALEGERVEIKDGQVHINGAPLTWAPWNEIEFQMRRSTEPHEPVWLVPPGHVFVLGDNPSESRDSRDFGPVDMRAIRGVAYKIWWPLDRAGPLE